MTAPPACTLCGTESTARVRLPEGCQAYPGDRVQDLCVQHLLSVEPIAPWEPLALHRPDLWRLVA